MPKNKGPKPEWEMSLPPEEVEGMDGALNNWSHHLMTESPGCVGGPWRLTAGPFGGPTMRKRDIDLRQKFNGAVWET